MTRRVDQPPVRRCGHPLGTTRWCPDCALDEQAREIMEDIDRRTLADCIGKFGDPLQRGAK